MKPNVTSARWTCRERHKIKRVGTTTTTTTKGRSIMTGVTQNKSDQRPEQEKKRHQTRPTV
jgi:hypothetical protein